MKIKQLVWEDCIPTISSSVVSRAQALGYTFEISASNGEMFDTNINGRYMCAGDSDAAKSKMFCQQWLESRIKEVVEVKAAEIRWHKDSNAWRGDEKEYTIWMYGDKYKAGTKGGGDVGDKLLYDTLEEAKAACQDHKQSKLEKLLCPSR